MGESIDTAMGKLNVAMRSRVEFSIRHFLLKILLRSTFLLGLFSSGTPFALADQANTTAAPASQSNLISTAPSDAKTNANESADSAQVLRRFAAPVLQKRFYALLDELRCPKCQNQNLADSDAPIAEDLRNELFRLLHEDYNDAQIKEYMVARFGSFVLYAPPASGYTAILWVLPCLLFLAGALQIWRITRRGGSDAQAPAGDQDG